MEFMLIILIAGIFLICTPFVLVALRNHGQPQDSPEWGEQYERTRRGRDGL
jgi:hypothetical protein